MMATKGKYNGTIFEGMIKQLGLMKKDPTLPPINCTMAKCNEQIANTKQLYYHIKTHHPKFSESQSQTWLHQPNSIASPIVSTESTSANVQPTINSIHEPCFDTCEGEFMDFEESQEPDAIIEVDECDDDSTSEIAEDEDEEIESEDESECPVLDEFEQFDESLLDELNPLTNFKFSKTINKAKSHPYFQKMMATIDEFKFQKKLPSKQVNELIVRRLDDDRHYLNLSDKEFSLFRKVASSDYLQDIYRQQQYSNYIHPKLLTIRREINGKVKTVQVSYIPLLQLCQKYTQNENYCRWIINERDAAGCNFPPNLQRTKGKMKIELYLDDANISPSGIFNKRQKYLFVYATFADLPYCHRVRSDDIEVVLVVNRSALNSLKLLDPLSVLLRQLKADLTTLASTGIEVSIGNNIDRIYPTISTIVADNLGMYELLGMKTVFANNAYTCRYCGANGSVKNEDTFTIQSDLEVYPLLDENLTKQQSQYFSTSRSFVFNGIDGVNKWNATPCDIFHDLAEGVLPDSYELILDTFCLLKNPQNQLMYTLLPGKTNHSVIEERFEEWDFFEGKPNLSWSSENGYKLHGKGFQKMEAFLILDAMLFDLFDPTWPQYQLFIALKEFTLLAFSTQITAADGTRMNLLSRRIVTSFTSLASALHQIRPKMVKASGQVFCKLHQLLHYGDLLVRFGPLFAFSSSRYERKHIYSKNVARIMRSFVNPIKSIHQKLQMNRAIHEQNSNFFQTDFWTNCSTSIPTRGTLMSSLPEAKGPIEIKLKYSKPAKRPFSLKKNILRRISGSARSLRWFRTTGFFESKSTGKVYCQGYVNTLEIQRQIEDSCKKQSAKATRKLNESKQMQYVLLEHLHSFNDYFFQVSTGRLNRNGKEEIDMYFIEWIY